MARAEANGSSKTTTHDLSEQIATLQNDLATLTQTVKEIGTGRVAAARDEAKVRATKAREAGERALSDAQKQAQAYYGQAEEKVRENPSAAVAIATGVGFLIGFLASRRS